MYSATNRNVIYAALLAALGAAPVLAADATPVETPAKPAREAALEQRSSETQQLESIVVTASKIEQPLQEAPIAVTAISGHEIERQNIDSFDDYLGQVPALSTISDRPGTTQLILRGISAGVQDNSMVSIYVDESPYGSTGIFARSGTLSADFDPFDMQRIEVLRGPQGTLYGANSLGGVFKFITTPPSTDAFSGQIQLQGSHVAGGGNDLGLRALVNVPLSETLALRANAFRRSEPGFIRNAATGRENVNATDIAGGRVALGWTPNEDFRLNLTAMAQNLASEASPAVDLDADFRPLYGKYDQYRYLDEQFSVQFRQLNLTAEHDFDGASLLSSTSYGRQQNAFLVDNTLLWRGLLGGALGAPFDSLGYAEDFAMGHRKFTQELRVRSTGEQRFSWQTGVYYTRERTFNDQALVPYDTSTRQPDASILETLGDDLFVGVLPARYEEKAAFGNVTWNIAPTFDITLGARYGSNEQTFSQITHGALLVSNTTTDSSDGTWTYLFNPRWRPSDDLMLYARVASGYRPGGPNFTPPPELAGEIPASFNPDTLVSYEIGLKGEWLDNRLSLDTALFYVDWSDVQLSVNRDGFGFRGNGGKARTWGSESSLRYMPLDGLTLALSATYTEARLAADVPGGLGRRGNRLPYVPRLSGAFSADYERPINGDWRWFVGTTYRYLGGRDAGFGTSADGAFEISPYGNWDLRAGVESVSWTLSAYVKNLRNDDNLLFVGTLAADPLVYSASRQQPRTVGFSVGYFY